MSNEEQDFGAWRTEQQRRAQTHAFGWAERATQAYSRATEHEDQARSLSDVPFTTDVQDKERRQAAFHGTRATEALKLAEMWARVAQTLAHGDLPIEYAVGEAISG